VQQVHVLILEIVWIAREHALEVFRRLRLAAGSCGCRNATYVATMTIILDHEHGERVAVTELAAPEPHSFIMAAGKRWFVDGNAKGSDGSDVDVCLVREWRPAVYSA
jgi:hypothetical protein